MLLQYLEVCAGNATDLLGRLFGSPLRHLLDQSEGGPRFLVAQVYRAAVQIVYNLKQKGVPEDGHAALD